MKRRDRIEIIELDDGTTVEMTFDRKANALKHVRAGKLGSGPDAGATASLSIDASGEWFERVSATVFKMARSFSSGLEICPDHGRWTVSFERPSDLRYSCPVCKPTPGVAEPEPKPEPTPTTADDNAIPF